MNQRQAFNLDKKMVGPRLRCKYCGCWKVLSPCFCCVYENSYVNVREFSVFRHDIRCPLSSIIGLSTLILSDENFLDLNNIIKEIQDYAYEINVILNRFCDNYLKYEGACLNLDEFKDGSKSMAFGIVRKLIAEIEDPIILIISLANGTKPRDKENTEYTNKIVRSAVSLKKVLEQWRQYQCHT